MARHPAYAALLAGCVAALLLASLGTAWALAARPPPVVPVVVTAVAPPPPRPPAAYRPPEQVWRDCTAMATQPGEATNCFAETEIDIFMGCLVVDHANCPARRPP